MFVLLPLGSVVYKLQPSLPQHADPIHSEALVVAIPALSYSLGLPGIITDKCRKVGRPHRCNQIRGITHAFVPTAGQLCAGPRGLHLHSREGDMGQPEEKAAPTPARGDFTRVGNKEIVRGK